MDKHVWLAENILPKNDGTAPRKKNLQSVTFENVTRKTRLTLCILGCWGIYFPPYNLARLSGLTRAAGFKTIVYDFNVDSYHRLKQFNLDDAWDANNHYHWFEEDYFNRLHSALEPILKEYIDKILADDSDIIGFSLYDTNVVPTEWLIKEIKKIKPNVKIIVGGPNCQMPEYNPCKEIDHYVIGEGEQVLIDFLEKFENNEPILDRKLGSAYSDTRIDIDSLPLPDYSDYDFSKYTSSYGISAELSRGCVAKCSFCRETWFWKYRNRTSVSILDEVEDQYKKYGISFIWFIDSLVNGNLKELREFVKGVVARGLDIKWMGYSRCDGRMDLEYFQDLKAGGCVNLSFGVESGSQHVLDMMRKKVKLKEINENLINSKKVGIYNHVNWIVGAPGETIQAMAHSLNLIWNHRKNIDGISPGATLGDSALTDYEFNRDRYDMSPTDQLFLGKWWSLDWTNTKLHRFIRLKYFNLWLFLCSDKKYGVVNNNQNRPLMQNDYELVFGDDVFLVDQLEYEEWDHMVIKPNLGVFADTVVNEMFGVLRMLWRAKGAYRINFSFDKTKDKTEFGEYISDDFDANIVFQIDQNGIWTSKQEYKFHHEGEWWLKGTKSFHCKWEGHGKWYEDANLSESTTTFFEGSSEGDNELISLRHRAGDKIVSGQTKKVFIMEVI